MLKSRRLFPVWFPLFLLMFFLSILALLFPYRLEQNIAQAKPDQVSVAYLRSMLALEPQNRLLRESLIVHYSQLGKTERALYELSELMADQNDSELLLWKLELLQFRLFKLELGSLAQQEANREILRLVKAVLRDTALDVIQLERVVVVCQSLGWYDLVASLYQRLSKKVSTEPQSRLEVKFLERLVDFFLPPVYAEELSQAEVYALKSLASLQDSGDRSAAAFEQLKQLLQLQPNSRRLLRGLIDLSLRWGKPRQARDWGRRYLSRFSVLDHGYRQQLKLELAANEPKNSLQWIQARLTQSSHNDTLLSVAISIALAAGDAASARRWGRAQLLLSPNNRVLRQRQIELEMGVSDNQGALRESLWLLKAQPNNPELRRSAAQLAEWSGDFETALTQWLWLSQQDPTGSDADHALLLAKQLSAHQAVVDLLVWRSRQQRLKEPELKELTVRYQALKQLRQGIEVLMQLRQHYPQQHAIYDQILVLYQAQDNLREAVQLLVAMEVQFGSLLDDVMMRVQLLMDLGQLRSGFMLLSEVEVNVAKEQHDFWHLYADLAWRLKENEVSKRSYAQLWQQQSLDQYEAYRYLTLLQPNLSKQKFIELSRIFWHRFKEPSFLLMAMDVAYTGGLWGELDHLLEGNPSQYDALKEQAQYWSIKSALAQHHGDFLQAKKALRKAIRLNSAFQKDFFWLLINSDDKEELSLLLSRSKLMALHRSDLWQVMAAAYLYLQRPKEALVWYQKWLRHTGKRSDTNLDDQISDSLQQIPTGVAVTLMQQQVAEYSLASWTMSNSVSMGAYTLLSKAALNAFSLPALGGTMKNEASETQMLLTLQRRWAHAKTHLSLGSVKNEQTTAAQLSLLHVQNTQELGAYQLTLSLGELVDESMLFRFLGMKDSLSVQGKWGGGKRDLLTTSLVAHRYHTRWGEALGQGGEVGLKWAHRLSAQPKIQLDLYLRHVETKLVEHLPVSMQNRFSDRLRVSSLLAERSSEIGGHLMLQRGLESFWGNRSSGLFYKVSMGTFYTGLRMGYRLDMMLGRAVFGQGDLKVFLTYGDGGSVDQSASAMVGGRYSLSFD